MSGLYNLMGQFGGLFNNYQTNQYNQQLADWQQQQNQYQQDIDYWCQMQDYDWDRQSYDMWRSGSSRGQPLTPRAMPDAPGLRPQKPSQFNWSGFGGGMGGGGGANTWSATPAPGGGGFNYGGYEGASYQAQPGWENNGIDTANMVDPSAVIASAQPGIMEKMNDAFADAGNRFGSSGMVGTPYADALGDASRAAATDIANITNQYQYQSALDAAQREQERAMAEYQADFNAWAQQGQWGHEGQLSDLDRDFGAWSQMGDWQYGAGQAAADRANQQWMAQNDWRFQDYSQQQQFDQDQMMQMLPMMMQFMGGMF